MANALDSSSGEVLESGQDQFHDYFRAIASARYFIRKLFRQIDEKVRREGLDPLEHQALIQAFGSPAARVSVHDLAERLDVGSDVTSKVVSSLQSKGYVTRQQSHHDRRVIEVCPTKAGRDFLATVDDHVQQIVDRLQPEITEEVRNAVFSIFAFYLGKQVGAQSFDWKEKASPSKE